MTSMIEDPQIERLLRQIATAEGVSVETLILERFGIGDSHRAVAASDRPSLRDRLANLAREVDAIPRSMDTRTDNEAIGYDERGGW